VWRWGIAAALVVFACTGADSPPLHDAAIIGVLAPSDRSGLLALGATCRAVTDQSTECATGACHFFETFPPPGVCTLKCTADPQCRTGSLGEVQPDGILPPVKGEAGLALTLLRDENLTGEHYLVRSGQWSFGRTFLIGLDGRWD
jgi:hypothetical protein